MTRLLPGLCLGLLAALWLVGGCRPGPDWSWDRTEAGLPRQAVVLDLEVDSTDPDRFWAGYYASRGLAISHDAGATWYNDVQGLDDDPVFDLLRLSDGSLWAATRDGLLMSTDGGVSWDPETGKGLPRTAAFALASDTTGRVYVGLDNAGLYARDPGGIEWLPLGHEREPSPDSELATATILSLAASTDGTQLYAGSAGQGLFSSLDAGQTWLNAFPTGFVPNIAINPARPTTALASLRHQLVRTRDGGRSWKELSVNWAGDGVTSLLWVVTPQEFEYGTVWAGSGQGKVYCSQDEGGSWTKLKDDLPAGSSVLSLALAGNPAASGQGRLIAGTWTGIFARSTTVGCGDDRQDWTYLSASLGVPNANRLLAAAAGRDVLLGTRSGLFRWRPEAGVWTPLTASSSIQTDTSTFPPGGVTALQVAPSDVDVVYAGTAGNGLYRSHDGSATWEHVPSDLEIGIRALAIDPHDAEHVYILAPWERVYESHDGGRRWQARWTGLEVTVEGISLAIDPVDPSTIYLGTDTGLYRSRYDGEDWQPVGRLLDDQSVLTLAPHPASSKAISAGAASVLYIGASRGVYRSDDGGETLKVWGRGLEDTSVTALLFDPDQSRSVYAGTAYAGLFYSLDGGQTWQKFGPSELAHEVVESMAWGPSGSLFVASGSSVWTACPCRRQVSEYNDIWRMVP